MNGRKYSLLKYCLLEASWWLREGPWSLVTPKQPLGLGAIFKTTLETLTPSFAYLLRTPPRSEALRHSGGDSLLWTSATVTLYLDVELSRESLPGTEQKMSAGVVGIKTPSLPLWSRWCRIPVDRIEFVFFVFYLFKQLGIEYLLLPIPW